MQASSPSSSARAGPSSMPPPPPLPPTAGPSSLLPPLTAAVKPPPLSSSPAPSAATLHPVSAASAAAPAVAAVPAVQLSAGAARFRRAIEADQAAALSPNYTAPFRSAQDVVQRLLPYHVWNVPHADLAWALQSGPIGGGEASSAAQTQLGASTSQAVAGSSTAVAGEVQEPKRKRRRKEDYVTSPAPADAAFTDAHTSNLWTRYAALQSRAKTLRIQLTGGESTAAFGTESVLQLSRLASDAERVSLATLQEQLRSAREEARQLGYEVRDVDRVVINAKRGFDREQAREAKRIRIATGQMIAGDEVDDAEADAEEARAFSPVKTPLPRPPLPYPVQNTPSPGVGRPPYMPGAQSPAGVGPPPRRGPGRPPSAIRAPLPVGVTSIPATAPSTPGSTLPTHPIPLLLPLSSLPSLTALGIFPLPASHLGGSAHVSSPRPPPASQEPPALLLGLSDTMQSNGKPAKVVVTPGVPRKRDYTMHLSVVLGKLAPQQLQGLAAMMQAQSTAPPPTPATIEARGTTESKHQVVVRIAAAAAMAAAGPTTAAAGQAINVRPAQLQAGAVATRPPRPPPLLNAGASGSGSTLPRPPPPPPVASSSAAPSPAPAARGRPKGPTGTGPGRPPKNKK